MTSPLVKLVQELRAEAAESGDYVYEKLCSAADRLEAALREQAAEWRQEAHERGEDIDGDIIWTLRYCADELLAGLESDGES